MKAALVALSSLMILCANAQAETVVKKRIILEETVQTKGSPDRDTTGSVASPNRAAILNHNDECDRLYYRRNALFKELGLCFTRATAVSTFGNAGCQYDRAVDMPMTERQRAMVKQIVAQERDLGCDRKP